MASLSAHSPALRAALALVALGWLVQASCTGGEQAPGAGGGGTATTSTTSTTTTSSTSGTAGTGGCPLQAPPPEVPAGWTELSDWSCDCRLYYPASAALMPAPIVWEPCPASLGPIDCRKMAVDWPSDASPLFSRTPLYVAEDGTATLMFRRISDRWVTDMVADVDGAVRMAMMRVRGANETSSVAGCATTYPGYRWPRYALGVRGDDSEGTDLTTHQGLITGSVESGEPKVFRHYSDGLVRVWLMSETYAAWEDATTFRLYASPWNSSETLVTAPPTDPDNLHAVQVRWWRDDLFWTTNAATTTGINIWTANEGARPLIRWVGDPNRGAADLGTDGVDLVWAYGEGAVPPTSYATRSIMTAPYTTDSATVHATARRLRSDPDECIGCDFFEVGCGHAAHPAEGNNVLVVRISDGWSWRVPSVWPADVLSYALGVTCDEVFVAGTVSGVHNIARIRLDSLGPGEAPD